MEEREEDKGNGYFERYLAAPVGKLFLSVPRRSKEEFRLSILPPLYSRTDSSYINLLQASESALENFFEKMGLPYSRKEREKN